MTGLYYFVVKDFDELKFLSKKNMETLDKIENESDDDKRKKLKNDDPSLIKGNYYYPGNEKKDKDGNLIHSGTDLVCMIEVEEFIARNYS
jgi:hypothetical protein